MPAVQITLTLEICLEVYCYCAVIELDRHSC